MAQPMRHETDYERRRRELADSLEYATRVARDPEIARRVAEARAAVAAGDLDEADFIDYEELMESIRARRASTRKP